MAEIIINDQNFEQEVLKSDLPIMVDFWASWCGPCKMLGPIVDELAKEFEGKIKVGKLNVDDSPNTASKYNIMSIPTIVFFRNGDIVDHSVGLVSKDSLTKKINALLSK